MFHWICPECGREIAPTAKECPACDPSTPVVEPVVAAAPEPAEPRVETVLPRLSAEPVNCADLPEPTQPPLAHNLTLRPAPRSLSAAPSAAAEPLAHPTDAVKLPEPCALPEAAPRAAPAIPGSVPHKPQPQALAGAAHATPKFAVEPLAAALAARLPELDFATGPAWPLPGRVPDRTLEKAHALAGNQRLAGCEPAPQFSLPGPALAYELTSLSAAGVARMLWFTPVAAQRPRKSGTFVSVAVASGFLGLAITGVFYAMPTLAGSDVPPPPQQAVAPTAPPPNPRVSPAELEVTGVRFVTDLKDRRPEIHYLVVNHTNAALGSVVVNVTLRGAAGDPPLSQFSFRAPRLGPYESREMISSIERLNRPLDLPDWRDLQADVELTEK